MTSTIPEEVTDHRTPHRVPVQAGLYYDLSADNPVSLASSAALFRMRNLPEWRELSLPFRADPADLLPDDAHVVLNLHTKYVDVVVAEGPGFVVRVRARKTWTSMLVAAMSAADADGIVEAAGAKVAQPPAPDTVPFRLWRQQGDGAGSWQRDLDVPEWSTIARNYPLRAELESLMGLRSVAGTGRLLLWTGPPGTGKTWAIRALARAWRDWCNAHLVIDPERLFADPAYLLEVMAESDHDDDDDRPKSRLIVCEDADDFIVARERTGSGVGRMLNVADGLLGQGLNNIILLTANAPIARLDPALIRPGRLLAHLEFGRFTVAAARGWLGRPDAAISYDGATLAELYELTGSVTRTVTAPPPAPETGAYL